MSVRGLNKLMICGKLGTDPELNTKGKTPVCQLSVAAPGRIVDGDQTVEWVKVTVFGVVAENCKKYLSKGQDVLVEGRLQTDKYQAKDGTTKYSTKCMASNVVFLGGGKREKASSNQAESHDFEDDFSPF
jgi:single-strand DNA-binding protein